MSKLLRSFLAFSSLTFVLASLSTARAAEPAIIAKARAFLGSEQKLDAVSSLHFTGKIVTADGKSVAVEILFQKPCRQRITATSADTIEVTALDSYDAWQRLQDPKDAKRWKVSLLQADQTKRLRANTLESLGFFRSLRSEVITDLGLVDFEGSKAWKLAYQHAGDIVFFRYFDPATGRLLLTQTEQGGSLREEGELIVDGIRFAKKITTTSPNPSGPASTVTIEFDKITLNEVFADSLFAVPLLTDR
jgi:outer membrane lipoprotein-sorting protein